MGIEGYFSSGKTEKCRNCPSGHVPHPRGNRSDCRLCRQDEVAGMYDDQCHACTDGLVPSEDQSTCVKDNVAEIVVPVVGGVAGGLITVVGAWLTWCRGGCKKDEQNAACRNV